MKRLYIILAVTLFVATVFGQAPASFNYQAIIRDAAGNVRSNSNVSIAVSILQGSVAGTSVYTEIHLTNTNVYGLVNLEIGLGNPAGFASIDWSNGPYFIKIGIDGTEMGTSQLLSVPYALYAVKAGNSFSGSYNDLTDKPTIPTSLNQITLNAGNRIITNVATPANTTDAANKAYVDNLLAIVQVLQNGVNDYDGNHYNTKMIGSQIWMTENLKVTHYRNGVLILNVKDNSTWGGLTTGARCYYNNDSATYAGTYGALYNWYTVADSRNVCPAGWHVPTDAEWTTLIDYLGGESVAGGKLKEIGTTHWNSPNNGATNESGFTALAGGSIFSNGSFSNIGFNGDWWSSTEYNTSSSFALMRYMVNWGSGEYGIMNSKNSGFSVRCLRD